MPDVCPRETNVGIEMQIAPNAAISFHPHFPLVHTAPYTRKYIILWTHSSRWIYRATPL